MSKTSLNSYLYKTRKTLREACQEAGIEFDTGYTTLDECTHCSVWLQPHELVPDLDKNPICNVCLRYEGM